MNTDLHFSSVKQDWETPHDLFGELDQEFGFNLDACANDRNKKVASFISPEEDALSKDWHGMVWMNPPYGRSTKKWVAHAFRQAQLGNCTVVCLLAARTDTAMFHDYCAKGEVRFLRGRLKFVGAPDPAPFPSMIVIFRQPPNSNYVTMRP